MQSLEEWKEWKRLKLRLSHSRPEWRYFSLQFSVWSHPSTSKTHGTTFFSSQVRLAVAGAFHTHFMEPAVSRLEATLAATEIRTPRIPVISNVDAQPHADPDTIKKILARQVRYLNLWSSIRNKKWHANSTNQLKIPRWLPQFYGKQQWRLS